MTRHQARTALTDLVSATLPGPHPPADLDTALDAAKIVDEDDRGPADDGYVDTFDLHYAAAELYDLHAARAAASPQVAEFSAEGARFKRAAADYTRLAAWHRSRSTAASGSGIAVIELDPQTPDHLLPRSVVR